ncbi:MAG: hypothetical protein V1936_05240 [Patescibacteria group bacterium]
MDNFITVADFHSGLQIYVAWTAILFLLITLFVAWLNQRDVRKTVKTIENKFNKNKSEVYKHLLGMEANNDKAFAMNARTEKAFDWAFLRQMKAASLYSKVGAIEPANGSLLLAAQDLGKIINISRLMVDVREIANVFASIEEMKQKGIVNQERLLKIENDFKIKYENSIKTEE